MVARRFSSDLENVPCCREDSSSDRRGSIAFVPIPSDDERLVRGDAPRADTSFVPERVDGVRVVWLPLFLGAADGRFFGLVEGFILNVRIVSSHKAEEHEV